jgi:hypothetical protein
MAPALLHTKRLRLSHALSGSITALEQMQNEMTAAYTKGVVEGYSKENLN